MTFTTYYRWLRRECDPICGTLKPASTVDPVVNAKSPGHLPPPIITSSIFWTTRSKASVDFMGHICSPVPPTHLLCVNYGSFFSPQASQTSCALVLPPKL